MPLYEYVCRGCETDFEALVSAGRRDDGSTKCPKCQGSRVARKISLMANPVIKQGARSLAGATPFGCGAPACCGGGCGIPN